eukprot:666623-Pyramimonas_sp.AAC.1
MGAPRSRAAESQPPRDAEGATAAWPPLLGTASPVAAARKWPRATSGRARRSRRARGAADATSWPGRDRHRRRGHQRRRDS